MMITSPPTNRKDISPTISFGEMVSGMGSRDAKHD